MAQLAIKGHATRGREVIQLLEMLGGKSNGNMNGYNDDLYYFIAKDGLIYGSGIEYEELACKYRLFTLEEFEEKFPYKVGDKVWLHYKNSTIRISETITSMRWCNKDDCVLYDVCTCCNLKEYAFTPYKEETMKEIKSIDLNKLEQQLDEALAKETPESLNKWMNEEMKKGSKLININPKLVGNECVHFPIPTNMKLEVKDSMCYLYRDCGEYKENKCLQELKEYLDNATPEQLEEDWKELEKFSEVGPVADEYVEQCKENVKGGKATITYKICDDGMELIIPFNEEIVYDKCRWILRKKQPQYPKTYKECCSVLGIEDDLQFVYENIDGRHINPACISHYRMRKLNLYDNFEDLITCRDAYWKIAGKEMGLDKPWKPDWSNDDETKFCIYTTQNMISLDIFGVDNRILAFPTEEMRDMFHVNFKDLIEQCKELL